MTDGIMDLFLTKPAFLLARVDQICTALYAARSGGETLAQAELLLLLAQSDERDQISLSRAAGVDKSTTALILDNLAGNGLIERIADPQDRRRARPRLTAAGRIRAAAAHMAFVGLQGELTEPLTREAAEDLTILLRLIAESAEGPAPPWASDEAPAFLATAPSLLNRRALQVAQAHFLACAAPLSLTPRQFSMLVILLARPGMTQVGFSRLFGLDPSTTGLIMRNLLARGLIVDRVSPHDRRKRVHSITPAGLDAIHAAQPLVDRSERMTTASLDSDQVARLIAHLQRLVFAHSPRLRFPGELQTVA
ncbi:MarR family transcriptional regulator [Sphingomonas sp. MMS24-J13]|uniref:MarR family transcriptional regulator n=1 Tax=Sphingomonas sp. MMS24-J13 TaxID=3238686 RepID=UPI00384CC893